MRMKKHKDAGLASTLAHICQTFVCARSHAQLQTNSMEFQSSH